MDARNDKLKGKVMPMHVAKQETNAMAKTPCILSSLNQDHVQSKSNKDIQLSVAVGSKDFQDNQTEMVGHDKGADNWLEGIAQSHRTKRNPRTRSNNNNDNVIMSVEDEDDEGSNEKMENESMNSGYSIGNNNGSLALHDQDHGYTIYRDSVGIDIGMSGEDHLDKNDCDYLHYDDTYVGLDDRDRSSGALSAQIEIPMTSDCGSGGHHHGINQNLPNLKMNNVLDCEGEDDSHCNRPKEHHHWQGIGFTDSMSHVRSGVRILASDHNSYLEDIEHVHNDAHWSGASHIRDGSRLSTDGHVVMTQHEQVKKSSLDQSQQEAISILLTDPTETLNHSFQVGKESKKTTIANHLDDMSNTSWPLSDPSMIIISSHKSRKLPPNRAVELSNAFALDSLKRKWTFTRTFPSTDDPSSVLSSSNEPVTPCVTPKERACALWPYKWRAGDAYCETYPFVNGGEINPSGPVLKGIIAEAHSAWIFDKLKCKLSINSPYPVFLRFDADSLGEQQACLKDFLQTTSPNTFTLPCPRLLTRVLSSLFHRHHSEPFQWCALELPCDRRYTTIRTINGVLNNTSTNQIRRRRFGRSNSSRSSIDSSNTKTHDIHEHQPTPTLPMESSSSSKTTITHFKSEYPNSSTTMTNRRGGYTRTSRNRMNDHRGGDRVEEHHGIGVDTRPRTRERTRKMVSGGLATKTTVEYHQSSIEYPMAPKKMGGTLIEPKQEDLNHVRGFNDHQISNIKSEPNVTEEAITIGNVESSNSLDNGGPVSHSLGGGRGSTVSSRHPVRLARTKKRSAYLLDEDLSLDEAISDYSEDDGDETSRSSASSSYDPGSSLTKSVSLDRSGGMVLGGSKNSGGVSRRTRRTVAPIQWSEEESKRLKELFQDSGGNDRCQWAFVCKQLNMEFGGGRSPTQCSQHYHRLSSSPVAKTKWSNSEDLELHRLALSYYPHDMLRILEQLPGRTPEQCIRRLTKRWNMSRDGIPSSIGVGRVVKRKCKNSLSETHSSTSRNILSNRHTTPPNDDDNHLSGSQKLQIPINTILSSEHSAFEFDSKNTSGGGSSRLIKTKTSPRSGSDYFSSSSLRY